MNEHWTKRTMSVMMMLVMMLMVTMTLWWLLIVSTKRCVWNVANQGWMGRKKSVALLWSTTVFVEIQQHVDVSGLLASIDFKFDNTQHIQALSFEGNSLWSETFSHWSQDPVLCCSRLMQPPSLLSFLLIIVISNISFTISTSTTTMIVAIVVVGVVI